MNRTVNNFQADLNKIVELVLTMPEDQHKKQLLQVRMRIEAVFGNIVRTDVDVAQHYYLEYAAHLFLTLEVVLKRHTDLILVFILTTLCPQEILVAMSVLKKDVTVNCHLAILSAIM